MKLYINTASNSVIIIELRRGQKVIAKKEISAPHRQAEKLLPAIEALLKANQYKLSNIKEVLVETRGEGFTSLRIGVVTANTLNYALKNHLTIAQPKYSKKPNITLKK